MENQKCRIDVLYSFIDSFLKVVEEEHRNRRAAFHRSKPSRANVPRPASARRIIADFDTVFVREPLGWIDVSPVPDFSIKVSTNLFLRTFMLLKSANGLVKMVHSK
jgi:hypothetical protein